jgi:hypothetical protein
VIVSPDAGAGDRPEPHLGALGRRRRLAGLGSRASRTQLPTDESCRRISRATCAILPPDASTIATTSASNSGVNFRRLM